MSRRGGRWYVSYRAMRSYLLAAVSVCLISVLSGCGSVYYAISVNAAQAKLEQAREMGAEQATPYEYHYAREHLREAQIHASEASYGDAANFAETAETYAQKAIDQIQAARRVDKDKDGEKSESEKAEK